MVFGFIPECRSASAGILRKTDTREGNYNQPPQRFAAVGAVTFSNDGMTNSFAVPFSSSSAAIIWPPLFCFHSPLK
jgi:hypothetical protein